MVSSLKAVVGRIPSGMPSGERVVTSSLPRATSTGQCPALALVRQWSFECPVCETEVYSFLLQTGHEDFRAQKITERAHHLRLRRGEGRQAAAAPHRERANQRMIEKERTYQADRIRPDGGQRVEVVQRL